MFIGDRQRSVECKCVRLFSLGLHFKTFCSIILADFLGDVDKDRSVADLAFEKERGKLT